MTDLNNSAAQIFSEYDDVLRFTLNNGKQRGDRTGTGTISVFGPQIVFPLSFDSIPIAVAKKIHFKSVLVELLWFLRGESNTNFLTENGVTIWNEWADDNGELGPVYGVQWRSWPEFIGNKMVAGWTYIDQIRQVIDQIQNSPESRRLLVSAWNVADLDKMALPPCHFAFQFYVEDGRLSCKMSQRSADAFLGLPFNVTSYALLTIMIAKTCGLGVDRLIISLGDCHIYNNHIEQVTEYLARTEKDEYWDIPAASVRFDVKKSIDDYRIEDFELCNYKPMPAIRAPIAI